MPAIIQLYSLARNLYYYLKNNYGNINFNRICCNMRYDKSNSQWYYIL